MKKRQKLGFVAGFHNDNEYDGGTNSLAPRSVNEVERFIQEMENKEQIRMEQKFGGGSTNNNKSVAEVAKAIQAAVMWSLIYNPIENGPFMPVSRSENWASFGDRAGATTPDWTYVIFGKYNTGQYIIL